jgi:hypothetical protein
MYKKNLLGDPIPKSQYVVITDGGHIEYVTLQQAKKLLNDKSICAYIFKIPKISYCSRPMLKYPLGNYYSCSKINMITEEVWCSLNVENLRYKEKDFSEYIKLKSNYNEYLKKWEIKIEYCTV